MPDLRRFWLRQGEVVIHLKKGDKLWNTYFVPRSPQRRLAVGSATVDKVKAVEGGFSASYHVTFTYDETDSDDAFEDRYRRGEERQLWNPYLTAEEAIWARIRECEEKVRQAEEDYREALALLEANR